MNDLKELRELTKELTVLCVEDSKFILKQLGTFLNKIFKEVYESSDGLDGLEKYKQYKPDIVFTDLTMPNMTGFEMIAVLKKLNPKVKIIIISAHADIPNILKAVKFGIYDFVAKPIDKELLQQAIYNLVHNLNTKSQDSNFMKILQILYQYKIELEFTNHYRGVPIINEGYIVEMSSHNIIIDVPLIQRMAIQYEKHTLIETNVLDTVIEAKFDKINKDNNQVFLTQFKEFKISSKQREQIRVDTDDDFKIVLHYKGDKIDALVDDISLKAVALKVKKSQFDFIEETKINLTLGFKTHLQGGVATIEHNERVPAKGTILKVIESDLYVDLVILFEVSKLDQNILKKYIYEREIELIEEFKNLK